jgi:hypothetical protein
MKNNQVLENITGSEMIIDRVINNWRQLISGFEIKNNFISPN